MVRFKKFLFRYKYVFGAFAITLLSLIVYAIAAKIAPFGQYALLSMDMHGQYYPMMIQKLENFFSLWSWNGSLGFSAIAQSAYYTNSIFLILLAPFSDYARICALDMMIFFKISLASTPFLRRITARIPVLSDSSATWSIPSSSVFFSSWSSTTFLRSCALLTW